MATNPHTAWPEPGVPIVPEPKKPHLSLVASRGVSASALMAMTFEPIRYVVPDYIAEGLSLFAGAPKIGKSWMMMDLAVAVASGGEALGSVKCEPGDVLYLALEDNLRRLQKRLKHMQVDQVPDRLTFMTDWPDLDHGCIHEIERWLQDTPGACMVIIDVFAKIKGGGRAERPQYEVDYAAATGLQKLAGEHGVAVIIVHHTRKADADDPFDTVSGTLGLPGAADTTLVLKRDPAGQHPILYGRGRDVEEFKAAMQFDRGTGRWNVVGDAAEVAKTSERQAILHTLKENGEPMTATELAGELGKKRDNIQHLLKRLVKEGKVEPVGKGKYVPISPFTPFTHDPKTGEILESEGENPGATVHSSTPPFTPASLSGSEVRERSDRRERYSQLSSDDWTASKAEAGWGEGE